MVINISKINRIFERNEMLETFVNNLSNSVNNCSNDVLVEMRITKGHLDFIHYKKLLDTNDYNTINELLGEIGIAFKKCKCDVRHPEEFTGEESYGYALPAKRPMKGDIKPLGIGKNK
jgi:hypothetical protein